MNHIQKVGQKHYEYRKTPLELCVHSSMPYPVTFLRSAALTPECMTHSVPHISCLCDNPCQILRSSRDFGEALLTTMAESQNLIFVNYNQPNPRPTQTQRRKVSAFIGKHFRNRSAPARRAQPPPQDDETPLPRLDRLSPGKRSPQVLVAIKGRPKWHPLREGGNRPPHIEGETGPVLEVFGTSEPRADNDDDAQLVRPVVECYVPAYPPEHRHKVVHILDFSKFCPSHALAHVARLPSIRNLLLVPQSTSYSCSIL